MNQYIGKTLGSYQILEQIGKGGMATIFKAYQPSMDRYVAVKVLPSHFTEDENFVARFTQEARTLARLEHPHILPVHDYGEQEGITYLVMRYIDAGTLKELIAQKDSLSLPKATRIFVQIGNALGYAHSQGVIHRDIKPANVLIDDRGDAFLTDFGIAKVVAGSSQLTATGAIIGTPAYMAPEQGVGMSVDYRSDIYALGVVLYEMVTGQVPFEAETPLAVLLKHVNDPLPPPRQIKPDLPESVERVILKAMAKSPDDRFQAAEDMVNALQDALAGMPTELLEQRARVKAQAPTASTAPPAAQRRPAAVSSLPPGTGRQIPWLPIVGGLLGLAALVVVAFLVLNNVGGKEVEPTPTEYRAALATTQLTTPSQPTIVLESTMAVEPTIESVEPSPPTPTSVPVPTAPRPASSWTNYSNGNFVYALALQDDYLWAGGDGGLVRWNLESEDYVKFTLDDGLASNQVRDLLVDNEEDLWVATDAGISRYDGETWTTFDENDGLDSHWVNTLYLDDDGNLWAGTAYGEFGLGYYDGETWGDPPLPMLPVEWPKPRAITLDDYGGLWVGLSEDKGLAYFDGEEWQIFTAEQDGLPTGDISDLLLAGDDSLFVAFDDGGLVVVDLETNEWQTLPEFTEIDINAMLLTKDDDLWFATPGGVIYYDLSTKDQDMYEWGPQTIPAWGIHCVAENDDGVWFGSDGGVTFYDGKDWETFTTDDDISGNYIEHIAQDGEGALWFMHTGEGLDRYDPVSGAWQNFGDEDGANDWPPLPGIDMEGQAWIGDYGELLRFDGRAWQSVTPTQLSLSIPRQIAFGPNHIQWVVTNDGLWRHAMQSSEWTLFTADDHPALEYVFYIVVANDGTVWVDGKDALLNFDGIAWSVPQAIGAAPDYVSALAVAADGSVWVTSSDIYHLDDGEWYEYRRPGDFWIDTVTLGPDGNVWVGGSDGLGRFDPETNIWQTFSTADGLIHNSVLSIHVTPAGVVWVGTSNGLSRFTPGD